MIEDFSKILRSAVDGDRAALETIIKAYWRHLERFVQRKLPEADASDRLQDFFVHLIRSNLLSKFKGETELKLRNYLLACLQNHLNSHFRGKAKLDSNRAELGEGESIDDIARSSLSLEESFMSALTVAELRDAIHQLPLNYKTVIRLSLDGYAQREIAEMLKMPPGTVASNLKRAREQLYKILADRGVSP